MDNSVIAKSGWLYRRLNHNETREARWQKCYVELYRDGFFKFYENDHSPNADDTIFLPSECISIKTGYQVIDNANRNVSNSTNPPHPPNGLSVQLLFSVSSINNKTWIFCADSINELKVWQNNLEEARLAMMMKSHLNPPSYYPANANPLFFNQTIGRNCNNAGANNIISAAGMNNALNPLLHHSMLLPHQPTNYLPSYHSPHHASAIAPFSHFTHLLPQQPTNTTAMFAPHSTTAATYLPTGQLFAPGMSGMVNPSLLSTSNNMHPQQRIQIQNPNFHQPSPHQQPQQETSAHLIHPQMNGQINNLNHQSNQQTTLSSAATQFPRQTILPNPPYYAHHMAPVWW